MYPATQMTLIQFVGHIYIIEQGHGKGKSNSTQERTTHALEIIVFLWS